MIAAIRLRPSTSLLLAIAVLAVSIAGGLAAEQIFAGPQGHGTSITPNGWYVTPAGQQVDLADETWWGDRPFGQALSPDGGTLLVSSNGQSPQSLKVSTPLPGQSDRPSRTRHPRPSTSGWRGVPMEATRTVRPAATTKSGSTTSRADG